MKNQVLIEGLVKGRYNGKKDGKLYSLTVETIGWRGEIQVGSVAGCDAISNGTLVSIVGSISTGRIGQEVVADSVTVIGEVAGSVPRAGGPDTGAAGAQVPARRVAG